MRSKESIDRNVSHSQCVPNPEIARFLRAAMSERLWNLIRSQRKNRQLGLNDFDRFQLHYDKPARNKIRFKAVNIKRNMRSKSRSSLDQSKRVN